MSIFRKNETRKVEIHSNTLIEHLNTLHKTEDEIHIYNKYSDIDNLINTSKERKKLSKKLSEEFLILEQDIKFLTNGIGPENQKSFNIIKNYLLGIDKILKLQLSELGKEEVISDSYLRTIAINGEKLNGDSELTISLKGLSNHLEEQSGLIVRYIEKIDNEVSEQTTNTLYETFNDLNYKIFEGRPIDTMSQLLEEGYEPITIHELIKIRVHALESGNEDLIDKWVHNNFIAGDSIIYHPDGRIKVVIKSQRLRKINSNSSLSFGSLKLLPGTFDETQGVEFSKAQVEKFANKSLKQSEARENPIWLALAQYDIELLKRYVKLLFLKPKMTRSMPVRISKDSEFECERLWCLNNLFNISNVNGNDNGQLDYNGGRLIGVAPKVQR